MQEKKASDACDKCGQKLPHPRNEARHKLFFAVLKPAMKQWPESAEFQPEDVDHLRSFLLCKSGHCTYNDLSMDVANAPGMIAAMKAFMEANISGSSKRVHFKQIKTGLRAYTPKSIAFTKCSEADFKVVLDKSIEIIVATIGVPIEQLKREAEREV